jgi:hypothetical protein
MTSRQLSLEKSVSTGRGFCNRSQIHWVARLSTSTVLLGLQLKSFRIGEYSSPHVAAGDCGQL